MAMFNLRFRVVHLYIAGAVLLGLFITVLFGNVLMFEKVNAESGPSYSASCSISVYGNGSNPLSIRAVMTITSNNVQRLINGWPGIYSPWIPYITSWNTNYYHTYSSGGGKTVYGRFSYVGQGSTVVKEAECSRGFTLTNPNNPANGSPTGSCNAAGALSVYVDVNDLDGGTPGFSMHIDNVGDFGMDYGGDGWRGTWYPPRNGVTYSIWIHVVDPQTGGVYGPFYGSYTCPPPPTPPACTLSVNPALVAPGGSSTLTWWSSNATSFTVDQGVGALSPVAGGARTVGPVNSTRTYTGTVSGPGGSANCSTTLTVGSVGCSLNSIATIEPGDSYTPSVTVNYVGGAATVTATVTVIVNGTPSTYVIPATAVPGNTSLTVSTAPPITFVAAGNYPVTTKSVSGTVNGAAYGPTTCTGATNVLVVFKPYFKVFNGGASVGTGFNVGTTTCAPPADPLAGRVSGFASNSTGFLRGASTQYDLKVLRSVATTFYSSGANTSGLPNFKALTLANTTPPDTTGYGGNFGGSSCITDYYSTTKKDTIGSYPGNGNINIAMSIAQAVNDQVESTSGRTFLGGTVTVGQKLAIYVTGDVYISGNVILDSNYNSLDQIPFFALVVKGSIKIAPGVTRLDGLYIAQPNGATGGTVYTCLNADDSVPNLYTSLCHTNKLTFNGSVVAKSIKLLRTVGTLRNAPVNEVAGTPAPNTAAEVFNGMPELYFAKPAFKIDVTSSELYDSITSLPPLL